MQRHKDGSRVLGWILISLSVAEVLVLIVLLQVLPDNASVTMARTRRFETFLPHPAVLFIPTAVPAGLGALMLTSREVFNIRGTRLPMIAVAVAFTVWFLFGVVEVAGLLK